MHCMRVPVCGDGSQMIVYSLFNMIVLMPKGLDVCSEVIVLFPIIYKLPCIFMLRFYAMLYNLFYYVPFVRNKVRQCAAADQTSPCAH